MSDGNTALALALGAGSGFLLWYFLRDENEKKKDAHAEKHQDAHGAAPTDQAARPGAGPAPTTAPAPNTTAPAPSSTALTPSPRACALRLDPSGLTADGARVTVADAVTRCKAAGRADVTIVKDAPAAVFADLMIALGRAEVPTTSHRNGSAPRGARRRVQQSADSVDLPEFASFVLELADQVDEDRGPDGGARGRFGRKVFIAAIRRGLRGTKYARLPRAAVDELLIRAHRARLLELTRADLVAAMDTDEVRDSEIVVPNAGATLHFVVAERGRNSASSSQFTLAIYARGDKGPATVRWFRTNEPIPWEEARDRLVAARVIDRSLFRRTREAGGWVMTTEPKLYRSDRAEPLPGGSDDPYSE
jgi:hypothetical protein